MESRRNGHQLSSRHDDDDDDRAAIFYSEVHFNHISGIALGLIRYASSTAAWQHYVPGLPWGWHFNPHTHPIPTGIPMGIPIPTEPEISTLLHVGLPSAIGRFLLFVR